MIGRFTQIESSDDDKLRLSTASLSLIWTVTTPPHGRIPMNRIERMLVAITALALLALRVWRL